jgi:hypothetical protein
MHSIFLPYPLCAVNIEPHFWFATLISYIYVMCYKFFPLQKQKNVWVINMGELAFGAIKFDHWKFNSLVLILQLLVHTLHPIYQSRNLGEDTFRWWLVSILVLSMTSINEFCTSCMIPIRLLNSIFPLLEEYQYFFRIPCFKTFNCSSLQVFFDWIPHGRIRFSDNQIALKLFL